MNKVRLLRLEDNSEPFAFIKVHVTIGFGRTAQTLECEIDQETGDVTLPKDCRFDNVKSKQDADEYAHTLPTQFQMVIGHMEGDPVVVVQRGAKLRYEKIRGMEVPGELGAQIIEHALPPTLVKYWDRPVHEIRSGLRSLGVRTNPMSQDNSNRADVWVMESGGDLSLCGIYLVTIDDGLTFKLVMQKRWIGRVHLRKAGTSYCLRNQDKRARESCNKPEVRAMLDRFVFVPGEHAEDFSGRVQALESPELRRIIESRNDLSLWHGREDFWIKRQPATDLRPSQGTLEFLTYGLGNGSFGIIRLAHPVEVSGVKYNQVQFDHHSVVNPEDFLDDQGIMFLPPGSTVEIDDLRPMGKKNAQEHYPALACLVTVLEVPVGLEPRARSLAA